VENQNTKIDCHPINKFCNDEVSKILLLKSNNISLEEKLNIVSMSQMFSFWHEIQELLISAAQEIKNLNEQIKFLEQKYGKEK
jgi:hypothetical protein